MDASTIVGRSAIVNGYRALDPSADHIECNVFKTVTIHEFPDGVEVFLNERKETWSDGAAFEGIEPTKRGEGDRERSIARVARRAKTAVRRRCKAVAADTMVTLTYRENMQDFDRLQRDVKAFVRRVRSLGAFEYILCVERQDRGALHVHMACQAFPAFLQVKGVRVKSYNVLRAMWREVVGRDNGNIDVTRPRGSNAAHRIASYIAKYVSKSIEGAVFNAKSYWSSRGIVMPKPVVLWFSGSTETWDLVAMIAQDFVMRGFTDIAQYADRLNAFHWFSAARPNR